jgi:alkylresorcinol/alkylpyrone synthase
VSSLVAVHGVLPSYRYAQAELTESFGRLCLPDARTRALAARFHGNAGVSTRHLALPLADYPELDTFTKANNAFVRVAVDLGAEAVAGALAEAGLDVGDVDLIMSTTVTGVAVPSLDARIAARLHLRPDVKRLPMLGLGCMAGAAGIARLHDLLAGAPDAVAVLVSVELCSLTVQRDDPTAANMIASGLFGDGAAAVVMVGANHPLADRGPKIIDTRSHLYPDTDRAMGWDVGSTGLKIVLGAEVPELVETYLGEDVRSLLLEHDLKLEDVDRWISHPGGPKVIEAIESVLDLDQYALALTWKSLREVGNMSSTSVLHILRDTLAERPGQSGQWGVLMAMGPGFASELVLLQW